MEKYKNYLKDFIHIFFDEINNLLKEGKDDLIKGELFGYYNILTILKQQAAIFEIDLDELGINLIDENDLLSYNGFNK